MRYTYLAPFYSYGPTIRGMSICGLRVDVSILILSWFCKSFRCSGRYCSDCSYLFLIWAFVVISCSLGKPIFPCQRVTARWGKLDCPERSCDLEGTNDIMPNRWRKKKFSGIYTLMRILKQTNVWALLPGRRGNRIQGAMPSCRHYRASTWIFVSLAVCIRVRWIWIRRYLYFVQFCHVNSNQILLWATDRIPAFIFG